MLKNRGGIRAAENKNALQDLMFDFNKCHPIYLNDLIRIGNRYDGGYIISQRQIQKTQILLSFGINDDWSFEEDFSKQKAVKLYAYDYSTKNLPFMGQNFKANYAGIVFNFLRLKRSKVLRHLEYIRGQKRLYQSFRSFFREADHRFFIPKFIGQYDDEKTVCFETIFTELGNVENSSLFIKMDIEGGEYLCLPQLIPFFNKLNGIAIEFHNLAVADARFQKLLEVFSERFYVAHVHGNNCSKLIYQTDIPSVLEITFISKELVAGEMVLSTRDYPIEGLDAPNNRFLQDYPLNFTD